MEPSKPFCMFRPVRRNALCCFKNPVSSWYGLCTPFQVSSGTFKRYDTTKKSWLLTQASGYSPLPRDPVAAFMDIVFRLFSHFGALFGLVPQSVRTNPLCPLPWLATKLKEDEIYHLYLPACLPRQFNVFSRMCSWKLYAVNTTANFRSS